MTLFGSAGCHKSHIKRELEKETQHWEGAALEALDNSLFAENGSKSDDKTIKSGFGEKARVLEDNRDILPLLLPSVTKPTFQRIIYQL